MATKPPETADADEEPTDPMLEDPPGSGLRRPSLAPALATRISELPASSPRESGSQRQLSWVLAGGLLIVLALLVLIVSRALTGSETVPVLAMPVPVPVPDPEPNPAELSPEPVPDPTPNVEPAALEAPPAATEATSGSVSDEDPDVAEETPPEHLAVVVHPDNPVSALTAEEIRRLYLEDRHWADGRIAKPVGRYQAPALRRVFLELVLGTNHTAIKKLWEEKKAQGLERVRRLPSDDEVVQYVSRRPEALGYVDWAKLGPESREKVKVVFEIRLRGQ